MAELRRAVFLSPYEAEAHLLIGRIHLRAGRPREAVDALKISIWSRDTAAAHVALADAYLRLKDGRGARTDVQKALALDPASAEAKALLASNRRRRATVGTKVRLHRRGGSELVCAASLCADRGGSCCGAAAQTRAPDRRRPPRSTGSSIPSARSSCVAPSRRPTPTAPRCIVFTLHTPGGLLDSTRDINNAIIAAKTPVAVFVGPSGSRAASAGFLITIAADVAAMAPGHAHRRRAPGRRATARRSTR